VTVEVAVSRLIGENMSIVRVQGLKRSELGKRLRVSKTAYADAVLLVAVVSHIYTRKQFHQNIMTDRHNDQHETHIRFNAPHPPQ
jgi:hypothetical protein